MAPLRRLGPYGLLPLIAVTVLLLAVDSASVVLTRISSPDDIKGAGYAAAAVAEKMPTDQQTAVVALHVAERDAESHGITVKDTSFVIYPGGRVTLTGTKTAPTVLFHHFSWLASLARVSTTVTVEPLPYDS